MQPALNNQFPSRGIGRPQIVLLGNGLEYELQGSWDELVDALTAPELRGHVPKEMKDMPFPLRYEFLSTSPSMPYPLNGDSIALQNQQLLGAMKNMCHESNAYMKRLPELEADHIFTTNYSYCIEKGFNEKLDFTNPQTRSRRRFDLRKAERGNGPKVKQERTYHLSTGYALTDGKHRLTGIWHIHGECGNVQGIILGHDKYCRLSSRIESVCDLPSAANTKRYHGKPEERRILTFYSWPELFLFADVYILGLKMHECEFDLWWLLRRKQREQYADGRVYFYERRPTEGFTESRFRLLEAHGVLLEDVGHTTEDEYQEFYFDALDDIQKKIAIHR